LYVDSDEHDEIEEKDKCCVCRKFEPDDWLYSAIFL
jgi:hypothetical protein